MRDLSGQVVMITGGSGSLAGAVAKAFHQAGASLALVDRSHGQILSRVERYTALALEADLTSYKEAVRAVHKIEMRLGLPHVLIHTVGAFSTGPLANSTPEDYDRMMDLNLRSLFNVVQAVLPGMQARGSGFIAGVSAGQAYHGSGAGAALYTAAKSAVAALLKSLDAELRGQSIGVSVLYPMGAIDTPANRQAMPKADPKNWIDPDGLAEALLFAATSGTQSRMLELPVYPRRLP